MKQFRLISLKLKGHKYLGDLELNFCNTDDLNYSSLYNTIIIGPNGTGKSYILSIIVDLFRELYIIIKDIENGKRKGLVNGLFSLIYSIDGIQYCYRNITKSKGPRDFSEGGVPSGRNWREQKYFLEKDGLNISRNEIELPVGILASSFMLTDKFVFLTKPEDFSIYKYLGIRGTPSTAGTRSYIRNTVNALVNAIENASFNETLIEVLDFLDLDKSITLNYSIKRKKDFFKEVVDETTFHKFFQNYENQWLIKKDKEQREIIPWYGYIYYKKIEKDKQIIKSIVEFCIENFSDKDFVLYDVLKEDKLLKKDFSILGHLDKLNLINYPDLIVKKAENIYSFEGTSSGEAHFLSSIIGILANIKENSIVLIDEPEISLHPNWQMKYLNFLNKTFAKYSSCHFIISTHSHFLISDLKAENSKIIALKREKEIVNDKNKNEIKIVDLPYNLNTYGWSAEDVLYNVFNVVSTRNKFVADDIAKILNYLSQGDKNKVNKLSEKQYNELLELEAALKDNDPLKTVVKKILTKVSK